VKPNLSSTFTRPIHNKALLSFYSTDQILSPSNTKGIFRRRYKPELQTNRNHLPRTAKYNKHTRTSNPPHTEHHNGPRTHEPRLNGHPRYGHGRRSLRNECMSTSSIPSQSNSPNSPLPIAHLPSPPVCRKPQTQQANPSSPFPHRCSSHGTPQTSA